MSPNTQNPEIPPPESIVINSAHPDVFSASREILDHKLPGLNEALEIRVIDKPGQGGACHAYAINFLQGRMHNFAIDPEGNFLLIPFQRGPIKEFGVNGVSGEALIAINIDRLRSFQAGAYACADNAEALDHLEKALECLQRRTKERLARGVEGTSIK